LVPCLSLLNTVVGTSIHLKHILVKGFGGKKPMVPAILVNTRKRTSMFNQFTLLRLQIEICEILKYFSLAYICWSCMFGQMTVRSSLDTSSLLGTNPLNLINKKAWKK
jgi:hypothetical protein